MSDDLFIGTNANDSFNGGGGTDTVTFAGNAAGYRIDYLDDGRVRVVDIDSSDGNTGTDTLSGIQVLSFADRNYSLDKLTLADTRVNTLTAGHQGSPAVTTLADGGYVIAWFSAQQGGDDYGIHAQRYAANGDKIGGETLISSDTDGAQFSPVIGALADGGYVIAWTSSGQDGHKNGIFAQRYAADGDTVGTVTQINTTTHLDQEDANITAFTDGGYLITWSSWEQDGSRAGIYAQRFDVNGDKVGDETLINTNTNDWQEHSTVTALADGRYVISWDTHGYRHPHEVHAQLFDAEGNKIGVETRIHEDSDDEQLGAAVTALDDGGYVIAWRSYHKYDYFLHMQRFDANGNKVGAAAQIDPTGSVYELNIAALGNGGYVLAWTGWSGSADDRNDIYTQRFDADGNALEPATRVNFHTDGFEELSALTALDDGGYVITWQSEGQDGERGGIYAQRFDADGETMGASMLQITGTSAADVINAGIGHNSLLGLAGNDVLKAGKGNDLLDGGAGADKLVGGLGDDIYLADGTDSLVEQADAGNDTVYSSASHILSANIENLFLTGTDDIDGTGNAGDNVLIGNAGDNTLTGGDGNDIFDIGRDEEHDNAETDTDTMVGGRGDDIYYVYGSWVEDSDIVIEKADEGHDTVYSTDWRYVLDDNVEDLVLVGSSDGTGNAGDNVITGSDSINYISGLGGHDTLIGGLGDDIYIISDNDTIIENAGEGKDGVQSSISYTLVANLENLFLEGNAAIDGTGNGSANKIVGNGKNNILSGGKGQDNLQAGNGDDTLNGGQDNDNLTGGAGHDSFLFSSTLDNNVDLINDFSVTDDLIKLDNAIFKKLTASGALNAGNFVASLDGTAVDGDDYILYETDTGALFYDADGSGAGARVQFATIGSSAHAVLTATDFVVV